MQWLKYEIDGYPVLPTTLDDRASSAAFRSNRHAGESNYYTASLGYLRSEIDGGLAQLNASSGAIEGQWAFRVDDERRKERQGLRVIVADRQGLIDKIVGAIHQYVAERYQELRFGAAVETAFEVVRTEVDGAIASLVPNALPMLSAAFENAASDQPEHWANAAGTCRRLLKLAADQLRPAGEDLVLSGGKTVKMGDGNYVNRLVTWVSEQPVSKTGEAMLRADLEFLGARLDAADGAGQKGAHESSVTGDEASRYITATYLVLGDILRLRPGSDGPAS